MILPPDSVDLSAYSTGELLRLRERINAHLPSADLEDIDLNSELVRTFQLAKDLLSEAKDDDETPLSQKSAIINSLNALLKSLADTQKSLYTVKRQQKLENALVQALKKFPDLEQAFFDVYERSYES